MRATQTWGMAMSNFSDGQERFYSDVIDNNTLDEIMGFLNSNADAFVLKEYGITENEYFEVMEQAYESK